MRKDVRLGFAVGGVLLAVIIVAILVIHRGHNRDKAVAFDTGGVQSVAPSADAVSNPNNDKGTGDSSPGNVAVPPVPPTPRPADGESVVARPPLDSADKPEKSNDRWDALFASTAEDPIRAQLTSGNPSKPRSHKSSGPLVAPKPAEDGAANSQMDSGSPPAPARIVNDLSTASPSRIDGDAPRTHKIQSGETFVSISKVVYGDGRYFQAIADANPTISPEKLRPGMVIELPPASQVKASGKSGKAVATAAKTTTSGPALSADGKTYTVQKNDNLYKIAKQLYGKGEKEGDLYTANKDVIGPDSTRLKIGMVLRLPEQPTSSH